MSQQLEKNATATKTYATKSWNDDTTNTLTVKFSAIVAKNDVIATENATTATQGATEAEENFWNKYSWRELIINDAYPDEIWNEMKNVYLEAAETIIGKKKTKKSKPYKSEEVIKMAEEKA